MDHFHFYTIYSASFTQHITNRDGRKQDREEWEWTPSLTKSGGKTQSRFFFLNIPQGNRIRKRLGGLQDVTNEREINF